jgi:murein L,D-transpeptidase YcbB/YkuD
MTSIPKRRRVNRRTASIFAAFAVPLAIALAVGLGAYRAPEPDPTLALTANLTTRRLTITRNGEVVKEYDVAVGQDRYPTPRGNFMIRKIVWNPAWVPPPDAKWAAGRKATAPSNPANPMKLVKIFFREPDYYIHGTDAVSSLGEAASHGCLRMDPNDAAEVALLLMDNAGTARDWDWVKGILHIGEQRTVSLGTPAPLTITD